MRETAPPLTFARFREANLQRLPMFRNRKGEPAHSEPDGSDWSLSDWLVALAGEVGEAMSLAKALRRGDFELEDTAPEGTPYVDGFSATRRDMLGRELADVLTYADILGARVGVPLSSFQTFGEVARSAASALASNEKGPPPASYYWRMLLMHLGSLDTNIDRLEGVNGEGPGNPHFDRDIAEDLDSVAWTVAALASMHGLDLGEWVARKFNEVSARVGCDVLLGPVAPRWDAADIPAAAGVHPATFREPPPDATHSDGLKVVGSAEVEIVDASDANSLPLAMPWGTWTRDGREVVVRCSLSGDTVLLGAVCSDGVGRSFRVSLQSVAREVFRVAFGEGVGGASSFRGVADRPPATGSREGSRSLSREGSRIPSFSVRLKAHESANVGRRGAASTVIRFDLRQRGKVQAAGSFWLREKGLAVVVDLLDGTERVFDFDLHELARVAVAHVEGSLRPVDMDAELLRDVSAWLAGQIERPEWAGVSGSLIRDTKRRIDEHLAQVHA